MQFDAWAAEVKQIVAQSGRAAKPEAFDPNAMYVAFASGVSPEVYAVAHTTALPPSPLSNQTVTDRGFDAQASTNLAPAPVHLGTVEYDESRRETKTKAANPWIGWGLMAGFCFVILSFKYNELKNEGSAPVPSSHDANPLPARASRGTTKPALKPPTDAQKVARAKLAYATWRGDDSAYLSAVTMLGQVPKSSKAHPEAVRILGKWQDRKRRSEAHKAEETRAAALNAIKREREEAKSLTGDGDVQVAVYDVKLRRSTDMHVANRNSTFVYVGIAARNAGSDTVHVNPNDFTLADSSGNTASHESDSYSLGNYFDAVNLAPGQQTSGWLIFLMSKDKRYTLTRSGMLQPSVQKAVIP